MSTNTGADVSIVLAGQAGQGIETIESVLVRIVKHACYNVFATKEYMSRVRLGGNSTEIRIAHDRKVNCYVNRIDVLVALEKFSLERLTPRIDASTIVFCDASVFTGSGKFIEVPFAAMAEEVGGKIFTNTIAIGVICGILGINQDLAAGHVRDEFSDKKEDIIQKNMVALEKGLEFGKSLADNGEVNFAISTDVCVADQILVNGAEAIALGAIAGGCNFIASYPMSPSTAVLSSLAEKSMTFDIIAEQAEDEIAAINMALGAWYTGARGMVTTSGGGFALMCEGVSLAGMIESPIVIHVGQRPGPATGLPTRTEQGDLNMVLYAGHGVFPRIVLAPGTIEDGFYVTQKAFNLADKYQVPVFILSDQYYIDSYYNIEPFNLDDLNNESFVAQTTKEYKRYAITENGISPRGIPGNGDGFVLVDSDEHDEEGHITEDFNVRTAMVDKRLRKLPGFTYDMILPRFSGNSDYKTLVVSWGSTCNAISEALSAIADDTIAHLHFTQVYPLFPGTKKYLDDADKIILIEGNASAQLGQLIREQLLVDIQNKILKYSGEPFHVEELVARIKEEAM
ncbi:MAG TPA: 2-oxoacid:acceptor oxidoreductase subunit alpha [Candidatus Lokiarchaeia archaeon]|nr:2-oxoacid:acceptor oxidoreductase subunit alpha [Candidatus Lokiarchaeia archaeon]